jgi:hypothetical protein
MAANGKAETKTEEGKTKEEWPNAGKSRSRGGQGRNDPRHSKPHQKHRFLRALTNERRLAREVYLPFAL